MPVLPLASYIGEASACYTKNRLLNDCLCDFVPIMQTFSLII